jgi:hypothetical protein
MKKFTLRLGLPLLWKELTEMSTRKRTYIIRAIYAAFLFLCFSIFFYSEYSDLHLSPFRIFGSGRYIFEFLLIFQFGAIYTFLPAMMSVTLANEKERQTLPLLLLTDLRPWEILLQKFFSRLIPILTFLLVSLPVMAIAYSLGGITTEYLYSAVFLLLLTCLQVGAVSLATSSYCSSTPRALLFSYGVIFLLYFWVLFLLVLNLGGDLERVLSEDTAFALLPPYLLGTTSAESFEVVLNRSIPIIVSVLGFLLIARIFLIRRALVSARSVTLRAFRVLDRFMNWANRFVGGIVLVKEKKTLSGNEPIAWRETSKKSLGNTRYLLRILVVIEIPVLLFALADILPTWEWSRREALGLSAIVFVLWAIAITVVSTFSANLVASERSHQTLDLLLVTPLRGRDIIRQKMRGIYRIIWVFAIPFATVFALEAWLESIRWTWFTYTLSSGIYLVLSFLMVLIYLPMFSWVSLWVGLKIRRQVRAIAAALIVNFAWIVTPFFLLWIIAVLTDYPPLIADSPLLFFSPVTMIASVEYREFPGVPEATASYALVSAFNLLWYCGILFFFRWLCLRRADRYLGRIYYKLEKT